MFLQKSLLLCTFGITAAFICTGPSLKTVSPVERKIARDCFSSVSVVIVLSDCVSVIFLRKST